MPALVFAAGLAAAFSALAACFPPPSGMVGWWPGDGNANDIASTNNATLLGGATANAVGFVGQAMSFNGTNSYVQIPDSPALKPTNVTVEAWVRFTSLNSVASGGSPSGQQYIVFKQNTRSSNFEGYYLAKERRTGGDVFVFGVSSSAGVGAEADSAPGVATNVWYHIAGVRGPNFVQLYVNGVMVAQTAVSFAQNYGSFPLFFGSSGQSYWDHKFSGLMDEVAIYNRALTSNEIASIYAAGASGKCKFVNNPPVAVNDSYTNNEDTVLNVVAPGVLGNDTDPETNALTAILATDPAHGSLTLNSNGGFSYTPATNYNGPDSFTYRANDGTTTSGLATVSLTILPVNDPPVASNDTYSVSQGAVLNVAAPGVLGNDTDADGDPLTASPASNPLHGLLTLNNNGSFSYTPTNGYFGPDIFTYTASDSITNSGAATVNISVLRVNHAPIASNDGYTNNEDTVLIVAAPGVLGNDTDSDGDPLTAILATGPAHGSLTLNTNGGFSYAPATNYNGPDSFTYRANDGFTNSGLATVSLTILPVNDAPIAINDAYTNSQDTVLNVAAPGVLGNDTDADGDPLIAILATGPAHGSLNLNTNGGFSYTPTNGYFGPDSFTYFANDGTTNSAAATISINVLRFNQAPVANADSYTNNEDTVLIVSAPGVLGNDTDSNSDPLTAVLGAGPAHGTLSLSTNGGFTYTPTNNYNGPDSFTYRANDGFTNSGLATVSLTILPVNDPPVAVSNSYSVNQDTTLNVAAPGVLANDSDVDGNPLTAVPGTGPLHGSLNLSTNGGFSYTPTNGYFGPDSFTYFANDGITNSAAATISINVLKVNQAPVANTDSYTNNEDTVLIVSAPGVLGNDTDGNSDPLTAVLGAGPTHGTLSLSTNGGFTYTPATNYNGPDSFTYRANDGTTNSGLATVNLTVLPVNDTPIAVNDAYNASANSNLVVAAPGVLGNDTDVDGLPLTANAAVLPLHGSVSLGTNGGFTYTPVSNYSGPDSFTYTASDGIASSSPATVSITVLPAQNCLSAPTNLVAWWPGDGNASDIAGVYTGTLQGGATAGAVGKVGPAFSFNGTSAYVSIPDSPALRPANFTVEAWVKFNSLDSTGSGGSAAGQQYIIFKQNTRSGNFEGIYIAKERRTGGDVFVFGTSSAAGVGVEVDSPSFIATNVWYHIAAIRGPSVLQLYINGASVGQTTVTFPQDYGTLPLFFGSSGQGYWDHKFSGTLDEVSLYNRPLTSNEIAAIYNAGASGKCKGAVAPTIVTQPANQILTVGGTANFSVVAAGSAPLGYQWYKDSFKLTNGGNVSGATTALLTLTNTQLGDVGNFQVVVSNAFGVATSAVASLSTGVPPANDAFASAQNISGTSGSVSGNNANSTKQNGEPNHAGNAGGPSVWYNWTASSTSPVTFDTALSAFDTLLAVYTGNNVGALSVVASNNNISSNNVHSRLTFTPVSGTVYRIAVDGANGANGNLTLRWASASTALPNLSIVASAVNPHITTETFSSGSCAVAEGLVQAGTRRLIRFDTETENSGTADLFFGNPANNPMFVFAPCHAHYHFQNYMAYRLRDSSGKIAAVGLKVGFCILDVFRWSPSAPNNAKYNCSNQGIQVGWGDLYDNTLDGQWIDITGLPDGNYTMELEANPQGIIQESDYGNNIATVPISIGNPSAPPLNDTFASAQTMLGGFTTISGVTPNATKEAGEPNHAGNAGGHSVWYQWTAPSTKLVTFDTLGSGFNTLLAVYTGNSVGALSLVASNDDIGSGTMQSRVAFNATAGIVYNIAVDGFNGASGNLILTMNQTIQNDNFANCTFIGGPTGIVYGANTGATKESGEPNHAGNAGGSSIWYCWTAPLSGSVTFDTVGSTFNTLLAVYTGNSVTALTPIAANNDIDAANSNFLSRVTFAATGLTMYHIAIDGANGDSGNTTLNWNLSANAPSFAGSSMRNIGTISEPGGAKLSFNRLPGGEVQLVIAGSPQQTYRVEVSCDLKTWNPSVATLADDAGLAYFTDKATMNSALQSASGDPVCGPGQVAGAPMPDGKGRFYRAVLVEQK